MSRFKNITKDAAIKMFAPSFAKNYMNRRKDKQPMTADGTMTIRRSVNRVMKFAKAGKADSTQRSYDCMLAHFTIYLKRTYKNVKNKNDAMFILLSQSKAGGNEIIVYFKQYLMLNTSYQPKTINLMLSALQAHVNAANTLDVITWESKVSYIRIRKQGITGFRPKTEDLKKVVASLNAKRKEDNSFVNQRNYLMYKFAYSFCLRVSEMVAIRYEHINFHDQTIKIKDKGYFGKSILHIPDNLIQDIEDYLSVRGRAKKPFFFKEKYTRPYFMDVKYFSDKQVNTIIKKCAFDSGVFPDKDRPVTLNCIRRSVLTAACKNAQKRGLPLEDLLPLSRHTDIRTLLIYCEINDQLQKEISAQLLDEIS